jgi:hypothetical protein
MEPSILEEMAFQQHMMQVTIISPYASYPASRHLITALLLLIYFITATLYQAFYTSSLTLHTHHPSFIQSLQSSYI